MYRIAPARLHQGHRTIGYPARPPVLPERFRGLPVIDGSRCRDGCRACADACPTHAIDLESGGPRLDLGRCLFCTDCTEACAPGAIDFTRDHRLATRRREDLYSDGHALRLAEALDEKSRRLFGRSLKLRQVSAAGCNACEADLNVLGTIVFDIGRFGIQFVASPRHADGLVVTGPVSENMRSALLDTYAAVPAPKLVIAVGACAISGGPYIDHPEVHNGLGGAGVPPASSGVGVPPASVSPSSSGVGVSPASGNAGVPPALLPVDLFIPGCPPHPITILDGLLRLLGRLE